MRNVHERLLHAPADAVGPLLDRLGSPEDSLWPSSGWVPMVLDRPLQVGADGGHGPIRYHVTDVLPGRRVRFAFGPGSGLLGWHEFTVTPVGADRCLLRHVLEVQPRGVMRLAVPLVVESLHDALLEDLLDNAEMQTTGVVAQPARWSAWVRQWWWWTEPGRPRAVPVPETDGLAHGVGMEDTADRVPDLADAWRVPLRPGHPTDPQRWADAVFRDPPAWVWALLVLRNQLVPLLGIERSDGTAFATRHRTDREVVLGEDAGHLDFRGSVLVEERGVTLSTLAYRRSRRGWVYLTVVRVVHPVVVRAMLHRASRRLALAAHAARLGRSPQEHALSPIMG